MSTLVIDSAAGVLPRLKAVLKDRGLPTVLLAKTISDALVIIDKASVNQNSPEAISLIIIDSRLEDGDGFELCRKIRKLPNMDTVYIIMLVSSVENKTDIAKAKQSGANDYAVKPYDGVDFTSHLLVYAYKKTVLLVDDDPVIVKLVSAILYKKKLEVIVENDGLSAYNLINTIGPPKLVLLDIGLPGMSGIKLIERIRSKNLWRNTPVLMLTGSKDVNDVKVSLAAGANDYIVKPFQLDDFNKRIDKFIKDVS